MYNNLFLNQETPLLAVDIGLQAITIAQLILRDKIYELENIGMVPLPKDSVVDGLIENPSEVAKIIKKLVKTENCKCKYVVASIPGDHCIVKKIKFLAKKNRDFDEELAQEVEQEIPFDIEDVRYDYQVVERMENVIDDDFKNEVGTGEKNVEIIMTAVQHEIMDNRFDTLIEAGLRPVIFDSDIFAAGRVLNLYQDSYSLKTGPCALFYLGDPYTHISIMNNGHAAFDQKNFVFGHCLTKWKVNLSKEKLKKTNKVEEYFENKFYKSAVIDKEENMNKNLISIEPDMDTVGKMLDEAEETFENFSQSTNEKVERIFICGVGALIYRVQNLIKDHFKIPVEIINPFSSIKVNPGQFHLDTLNDLSPQLAVVMGLAARRFDYR